MDLATQQRQLLGLFRSTYQARADDDPYIRAVAQSPDLEEARGNVFLWRVWVLERTAVLTFTLLKRRGLLEQTLRAFISRHNISPFRETQAPDFLEALSDHPDRLIACVARFELALTRVRQGDAGTYVIPWHLEPHGILHALASDTALPDGVPEGAYEIHVSRDLPGQFQIVTPQANSATTLPHTLP